MRRASGPRLVPDRPGYYEVRGGGRSDFIAVNVDPRESQLARWMRPTREALAGAAGRVAAAAAAPAAAARQPRRRPPERYPLWFWLLLAAAALAFLEPLVANYHLHVQRERRA